MTPSAAPPDLLAHAAPPGAAPADAAAPAASPPVDWAAQVTSVAIVSLDPSGIVRAWNAGATRIKGYSAAEVVGTSFERFYRPDDRTRGLPARLLAAAARDGSVEDTGWRVRADGSPFWAHVLITAMRDPRGELTGFVKIVRDRTDAKRHDEEKDGFLRTFAHDLLSPITALRGYVDLLEDEQPEPSELLQRVSRVSDHLIAMIGEFTAHVRGVDAEPDAATEADIRPLVQEAAELVLPGDVNERVRVSGHGRAALSADRAALRRAVANVVENAAKYSEDVIDIAVAETAEATTITVSDSGRGIHPSDLDGIFDPFERGRRADAADGGTGLGLASVRDLVRRSGGDVAIDSEPDRGTTVTLRLPPGG